MKTLPSPPGGLAGPPSAGSSASNQVDVFAVAGDGNVWRWSWDGRSWAAPVPLPAFGSIPADGVCAVSSGPGRVEVFAANATTHSPVWWRGDGARWFDAALQPPRARRTSPRCRSLPCARRRTTSTCSRRAPATRRGGGTGTGRYWTAPVRSPERPTSRPSGSPPCRPRPGASTCSPPEQATTCGTGRRSARGAMEPCRRPRREPARRGRERGLLGPNRIDVFAASRSPGNRSSTGGRTAAGFGPREASAGASLPGTVSAVSHAADRLDVFGVSGDGRIAHWQWDGQQLDRSQPPRRQHPRW